MKKGLKSAGIIALSAVLACGAIGALAGCGGSSGGSGKPKGDANELTVNIFCNTSDAMTNQAICNEWAAKYNAAHPELGGIRVTLSNNTSKADYFTKLRDDWSSGTTADIIYLSPKYVRTYAERGNILDLSGYLTADEYKKEDGSYKTADVWQNGISYYGYIKGQKDSYKMGRPIEVTADGKYVTATNEATKGDDKGTKVELYGLPKDYSNFSMGYNRLFFSEKLKTAYQTTKATDYRSVKGPEGDTAGQFTSKLTYTGYGDEDVITYAAGTNAGQPANIINVGIPTTYRPYNFFRWPDFETARTNKDPVAIMSDQFGGYTVTIPGFPNEEFDLTQDDYNVVYGPNGVTLTSVNANTPYNNAKAHITYTYAEYGALLWACTYYLNTYAWDNKQADPLNGTGGKYTGYGQWLKGKTPDGVPQSSGYQTVYGGEQYEGGGDSGAEGSVLYLLPWLASNDADLINNLSTLTQQNPNKDSFSGSDWREAAGTKTYATSKRTFADTMADKEIQYGHNSLNFIETYAAFLAIGSDWNGNPSGDTADKLHGGVSGWGYFRAGRSLFYGAGSWDAATRNDVHTDTLDFGQMPTPIAEKYALYSKIKDANYQPYIYSNDPTAAAPGSANEGKQRATMNDGLNADYLANGKALIRQNQLRRQDKWAARMDTVGYAVAAKVAKYTGGHAWKAAAAVSLTAYLTINEDAQKTLLYAGAQLPNFVSQCKDFVNYKTAGATGAFADMLTPEGFYDTPAGKEQDVWDYYYGIALEMEAAGNSKTDSVNSQTVAQFLANKKHKADGKTDSDEALRYDHSFDNTRLKDFVGATEETKIAYAMKILRMVSYRQKDRDINIRMQYGLNAVRDSGMYTYDSTWMSPIDARQDSHILTYQAQVPLTVNTNNFFSSGVVKMNPTTAGEIKIWTPAVWCFAQAKNAQNLLLQAVQKEHDAWAGK